MIEKLKGKESQKIELDVEERLMLMMDKAWARGISTIEFRKADMSDLRFIMEMEDMRAKKREDMEHNQKIKQAMNAMKGGMRRS